MSDRAAHILLIGDIASRRAAIRAMLEACPSGHRIGIVSTIDDALAYLCRNRVDLAILDSREGTAVDLDGIPVLRNRKPALPILAVVPGLDECERQLAKRQGACDCLALDDHAAESFAALIARHLSGPRCIPENREPHILIVEDEPTTAEILTRFVSWYGYRVSVVHNGRDALDLMLADPADLIITDLDMPLLDGESLIAELQACEKRPHIIVVTGNAVSDLSWAKLRHTVVELYQKPLNLKEIGRTVERLVGVSLRPAAIASACDAL